MSTKAQEFVEHASPGCPKSEPVRISDCRRSGRRSRSTASAAESEGYVTETVSSPAAALEAVQSNEFDIMLMDLNYQRDTTSGQEGIDLLSRVQTG